MANMRGTSPSAFRLALAAAATSLWLSGCSQVITTALPDLTSSDRPVLSTGEQERAIKEMIEKKNASQSGPVEDDEKTKAH